MLTSEPTCIAKLGNLLGEGPCWDCASGRLYWVDIKARRLHWLVCATGEVGAAGLPLRCTAMAPRAQGGLILLTEQGIGAWSPEAGFQGLLQPIAAPAGFRSNDGKVDLAGRFWWSMMDDDKKAPGFIGRYDPDGGCERVIEGVVIANTLSCAPDGRTFYYADSDKATLYACDLDPATGRLSRRRELANTRGTKGAPDGSAVDEDGFLWNAQWGLGRVVRYAPDGRIDRIVEMPVDQPSSCAFGGPALDVLYVTSATDELPPERLAETPLAGGLFAFKPGVKGLDLPAFAG